MHEDAYLPVSPGEIDCEQLVALFRAGAMAELENRSRSLLEKYPESGFVWKLLGAALRAQGKDALSALQKATRLMPDDAEAHNNLANTLQDLDQLEDAVTSFRRALEIKPDFAEAHNNLGNALESLGQMNLAEDCYRRALQIKPEFSVAHHGLGVTLQHSGRLDEAESCFRRALEIKPDFAEAHSSISVIHQNYGRLVEARASARRALEIKPSYTEALFGLVQAEKVKPSDPSFAALIAIEQKAKNAATSRLEKKRIHLHFALGKCYDDTGDYDKAFKHFIEGCRLHRATIDYDPDKTARLFAAIKHNFEAAPVNTLVGGGISSNVPIFVLGMPRSGTTLTEQIIASHPEVHGAGEVTYLMDVVQRSFGNNALLKLHSLDRERLVTMAAEYVARLQRCAPDARHIVDKMPANFFGIGIIHLMLPNAKIIHINRNPVDTCLSCFTKLFATGQEHTYELTELGRYYVDYFRLMQFWREVLPGDAFLDVQYEDVVADQEAQSRRIIEYCGLEWDDACLDFHKNKRAVQTASLIQVRQPMYASSVERWRPYEKYLSPLLDVLGDLAQGCANNRK